MTTAPIAAHVLTKRVEQYRREDLPRLDPYWDVDTLSVFSIECFGVPIEKLVGLSADELLDDWRDRGWRRAA